ncbi:MAG: hypothetical protein GY772_08200 [bacterium]|nr:hypothetical protein [bacterium]
MRFLGDSKTYGLYVEYEQASLQVLERIWNPDPRRSPMEVRRASFSRRLARRSRSSSGRDDPMSGHRSRLAALVGAASGAFG